MWHPGVPSWSLEFQEARLSPEVVLAESILDALSFHQAGISIAISIYGVNGFTPDHLDLLKRESVKRVILALDNDDAGRKGTDALSGKLEAVAIAVGALSFLYAVTVSTPKPPSPPELVSRPRSADEKTANGLELSGTASRTMPACTRSSWGACGHGDGDEGRVPPRGHDRPLRLEEPERVREARDQLTGPAG